MNRNEIPVLLLTGYLGSGKTTLLNHILANKRGLRAAVIVNDIGEVNIDAELIQKGGIVGQSSDPDDLVALQNGCICCTLKTDLIKQIAELTAMQKFDYIVIEASGVCEPAPIAQTICSMAVLDDEITLGAKPRLDCIATVVDALRMRDEFGCGSDLNRTDRTDDDIENLIIEQVEFCNLILLNKISEVSPEEAAQIRAIIRTIQPQAKIIECDYAQIDLDDIVNTHAFNFERVATSARWIQELEGHHHHHDDDDDDDDDDDEHEHEHHHEHEHEHHHEHGPGCHCHHCEEGEAAEYGITTFVYYRRRPIDFNRFDRFLALNWPREIIRSKGVVYFAHNRDMSFLFETAGKQKQLREAGLWFAAAPPEEFAQLMEKEPGLLRDWDETYGDRMIKLVFIGRNMDRQAIEKALDDCLANF